MDGFSSEEDRTINQRCFVSAAADVWGLASERYTGPSELT